MTVQGTFILIWIVLGVLSIIGIFRKEKFWFIPYLLLIITMFVGFWFDNADEKPTNGLWIDLNSGTQFGAYTLLLAMGITILECIVFFGSLLLGKFKEQEKEVSWHEIGNKSILLIVATASFFLISSAMMRQ